MTLTSRSMEWLSQNRHRSYPVVRDEWREKVSPESGLDGVLLDALVFNGDAEGNETMSVVSVSVGDDSTCVSFDYGGSKFDITVPMGEESGEGSYFAVRGVVRGRGMRGAAVSLVFSSHRYIVGTAGKGTWNLGCRIIPSRVVNLVDGFGVDGIRVNGSKGVDGHSSPSVAAGDVLLEDGYRTSPIIHRGKVLVRVGKKYGLDPCRYVSEDYEYADCKDPLFFFCGQNGVNNGNVAISGGKGISVTQGRKYRYNGMDIPCVEIVAGKELMDIYGSSGRGS